jgi:glutaredoxin
MSERIYLYSARLCSDCQKLKAFMDAEGIVYEVRDIKDDPAHADELRRETGKLGVPYLNIGGEWIRGYDPAAPFSEEFARSLFSR